jgi:hypothetical protein
MTTGLAITAACLIPLGVMVYLVWAAPEGWEDSEGFHLGTPGEHSDYGDE